MRRIPVCATISSKKKSPAEPAKLNTQGAGQQQGVGKKRAAKPCAGFRFRRRIFIEPENRNREERGPAAREDTEADRRVREAEEKKARSEEHPSELQSRLGISY